MWIDIFVSMWEEWSQKSISYNRELKYLMCVSLLGPGVVQLGKTRAIAGP